METGETQQSSPSTLSSPRTLLLCSVKIRIIADGAASPAVPLGNDLRPRHLARRIEVDPADYLDAREWLVQILQLVLLDLTVNRDGLVVVVELHVARVVAHGH